MMLLSMLLLAAQAAPAGERTRDVVVTARRRPDAEAERTLIRAVSAPTGGQLARFHDPLCVAVLGLAPEAAEAVRVRIGHVARAAGAPVASDGCQPNGFVIVAGDAARFVAEARRTHAAWFAGMDRAELARVAAPGDGVHVWSATGVRNEDGMSIVQPVPGRRGDLSDVPILRVLTSSLVNPHTQQSIEASFAVIDARRAVGKTTVQLADYLALRLLAKTRPPSDAHGPATILTLFGEGGGAPEAITAFDEGYLRGLYKGAADRSLVVQQRAMERALRDDRGAAE